MICVTNRLYNITFVGGWLPLLQYASKFAPIAHWIKLVTASAAHSGNLELLQWLRANGCAWDADTCSNAARNGHLHVLKWARANGCEWSSYACACAAGAGRLDMLQWLHAEGCDTNDYAYVRMRLLADTLRY